MSRRETKRIGSIIHPNWNYDLEASLAVHRMLMQRAKAPKWRFKGTWVTTGPYETLCGRSGTGRSITSEPSGELELYPGRDGLKMMVQKINGTILKALCEYGEFASLDETVTMDFVHCGDLIQEIGRYEGGRSIKKLNSHHKKATLVKDVGLFSCGGSLFFDASISFNTNPTESRWSMYSLLRERCLKIRKRERLATFLNRVIAELEKHAKPKNN